jgi:sirohydrochlorin cobaltochelatase
LSSNEALLLVGHGSVRYPDAGSTMIRHARSLREDARFAQIEVALLNGTPSVDEALARIEAPTIRVVPFFMEDGYFNRVAVPRALRGRAALLCPPVGVHDGMAGLIERQALAACDSRNLPSHATAVLVVGHGSSSAPGRSLALHRHASRVAATELFVRVEAACLEEAPFVADALHGLRAHSVIVIGYFGNHGGHLRDDVPALIAAEQAARSGLAQGGGPAPGGGWVVQFLGSVTDDPAMPRIIMDQAFAAASDSETDDGDPEGE